MHAKKIQSKQYPCLPKIFELIHKCVIIFKTTHVPYSTHPPYAFWGRSLNVNFNLF